MSPPIIYPDNPFSCVVELTAPDNAGSEIPLARGSAVTAFLAQVTETTNLETVAEADPTLETTCIQIGTGKKWVVPFTATQFTQAMLAKKFGVPMDGLAVAHDYPRRVNSATILGLADSGQAWVPVGGLWGIKNAVIGVTFGSIYAVSSNGLFVDGSSGVYLDAGAPNLTVTFKILAVGKVCGVMLGCDATLENFLSVLAAPTGGPLGHGRLRVDQKINDLEVTLITADYDWTGTNTVTAVRDLINSTLTVRVNGVDQFVIPIDPAVGPTNNYGLVAGDNTSEMNQFVVTTAPVATPYIVITKPSGLRQYVRCSYAPSKGAVVAPTGQSIAVY